MDQKVELQKLVEKLASGEIKPREYIEEMRALAKPKGSAKESKMLAARASSAAADERMKSAVRRATAL